MSEHARKRARAVLRGRDDGNIILLPDRSFVGWYRHLTLVMLAYALLVSLGIQQPPSVVPGADGASPPAAAAVAQDLVPLSVPEVRHLLAALLFPPPSSVQLVMQWSAWRRRHQWLAQFFHTRRRLKAG